MTRANASIQYARTRNPLLRLSDVPVVATNMPFVWLPTNDLYRIYMKPDTRHSKSQQRNFSPGRIFKCTNNIAGRFTSYKCFLKLLFREPGRLARHNAARAPLSFFSGVWAVLLWLQMSVHPCSRRAAVPSTGDRGGINKHFWPSILQCYECI